MWKRDEAVKPTATGGARSRRAASTPAAPRRACRDVLVSRERDIVNIGKIVVIKGELNGSEDLTIEGQVEGKIELRENVLTIGPNGKIKAQVFAKAVDRPRRGTGNVTATEKVDIRDNGSVDGDIVSPRVAIAEGAHFRGSVDMQQQRRGGQAGASHRPSRAEAGHADDVAPRRRGTPAAASRRAPARYAERRPSSRTEVPLRVGSLQLGRRKRSTARQRRRLPLAAPVARRHAVDLARRLPKFLARWRTQPVAGPARPRPGRRHQRQLLRRAARLQDLHRGSLRRHRAARARGQRATALPPTCSPRFTQADGTSTASCAGTSSTTSTGRRAGAGATS